MIYVLKDGSKLVIDDTKNFAIGVDCIKYNVRCNNCPFKDCATKIKFERDITNDVIKTFKKEIREKVKTIYY